MINEDSTRKIKVCHVTSAHPRYDVRIFHKECKSLINSGFDTTLLVNDILPDEIVDEVKIEATQFNPKNRFERIVKSKKYLKKKMTEIDAEIYHFHDPELLPLALWIKKKGKKAIFDSHEDYVSTVSEKIWIPSFLRNPVSKLFSLYESTVIKKIDGAIVCYHWTEERYNKVNTNTTMVLNFPILINEEINSTIRDKRKIAFAGGISPQWCHKEIITALSKLKGVEYELAGKLSEKYGQELQGLDGWRHVNYHGILPYQTVQNTIYDNSSIGMALLDYIAQCKGTIGNLSNTKFFEYMQMGLPLICTDFKLWKEIIDEEKCGICVNPHNIDEITKAIEFLLENPSVARKMGENGQRAIINKYNWSSQEKKIIKLYKSVINNK